MEVQVGGADDAMADLVDGTAELAVTDGQGDAGEFHSFSFCSHQLPRGACKNQFPPLNSFNGLVGTDPSLNRPYSVSKSEACRLC